MLAKLGHVIGAHAHRGIVDDDAAAPDRLQHDEVIAVPVQDRRRADMGEIGEIIDAEAPHIEAQLVGDTGQVGKAEAAPRRAVLAAEIGQVEPVTVPVRDHRHAGDPALAIGLLQDHGQRPPPGFEQVHPMRPLSATSGSRNHCSRLRRSTSMSAVSVIPTLSARRRP